MTLSQRDSVMTDLARAGAAVCAEYDRGALTLLAVATLACKQERARAAGMAFTQLSIAAVDAVNDCLSALPEIVAKETIDELRRWSDAWLLCS